MNKWYEEPYDIKDKIIAEAVDSDREIDTLENICAKYGRIYDNTLYTLMLTYDRKEK